MTERFLGTALLPTCAPASAQTLREAIVQADVSHPQLAAARARQEALEETSEQAPAAKLRLMTVSPAPYGRAAPLPRPRARRFRRERGRVVTIGRSYCPPTARQPRPITFSIREDRTRPSAKLSLWV